MQGIVIAIVSGLVSLVLIPLLVACFILYNVVKYVIAYPVVSLCWVLVHVYANWGYAKNERIMKSSPWEILDASSMPKLSDLRDLYRGNPK